MSHRDLGGHKWFIRILSGFDFADRLAARQVGRALGRLKTEVQIKNEWHNFIEALGAQIKKEKKSALGLNDT